MTEPDLRYSEVEEDLRSSVRALLTARAGAGLWRELVGLGVTSLPVPEGLGGQGAGYREVAVVAEELGASVAPVPFLGSAVLATAALLHAGDTPEVRLALSGTPVLAVPLSSWGAVVGVRGLTGSIRSVADAAAADRFLVPADNGLYLVEAADVRVSPVPSLDETRPVADLEFSAAPGTRLAGLDAVRRALLVGAGILASEQVGVAQWCLDTTVAYVRQRVQFGRPVGSFQAVKHRLADLWQELVLARAAARNAADALTTGVDTAVAVSLAQSLCATVAVRAAEECVQLHGGIGMTWEHPAHRYLKRAKANEIALGTPGMHRATLAPLIDLLG
ncbi:acyl-CoA dehydrogenase family protein [Actinokineospora auranticolor]|uniref:Alkylation response protein AidB-like acyl-CoA dehydrogenase n=1 Tax=Actinokineospora auranticolor TaxID=155976 RepID=A0A2S6H0G2_9PSEU|nr:acyl-CoA dehydrogenase family protein [Actinokineospora auranticolor]PPK70969.1 alkylation response protein AidB-like acyl-CoA dehydrogenase [Actinokineospora auranticolor]